MPQRLRDLLRHEPALVAWFTNGGLAALLAFVFHLGDTQTATVTTATTALAAAYTAIQARPVSLSVLAGALATLITACEGFGLQLPAGYVASGVAAISLVLSLIFRENLTPTAKLKTAATVSYPVGLVSPVVTTSNGSSVTVTYPTQGTTAQGKTE
jgi:hypothetical protein